MNLTAIRSRITATNRKIKSLGGLSRRINDREAVMAGGWKALKRKRHIDTTNTAIKMFPTKGMGSLVFIRKMR